MPRGQRGTQMAGLPVEHAKGDTPAGTLCGRGRKWGALIASSLELVDCKRCLKKLAEATTHEDPQP
jgi:hypothetical protein